MPTAAPKPCMQPGCSTLVYDGSSRCMAHKREAWVTTSRQVKRTTGRRLQAQRAALFNREPMCRVCKGQGVIRLATIRDHIKPLAEGGKDVEENTQPLCEDCHDAKTAQESLRGRGHQIATASPAETDWVAKFSRAGVVGGGGTPGEHRGGF